MVYSRSQRAGAVVTLDCIMNGYIKITLKKAACPVPAASTHHRGSSRASMTAHAKSSLHTRVCVCCVLYVWGTRWRDRTDHGGDWTCCPSPQNQQLENPVSSVLFVCRLHNAPVCKVPFYVVTVKECSRHAQNVYLLVTGLDKIDTPAF